MFEYKQPSELTSRKPYPSTVSPHCRPGTRFVATIRQKSLRRSDMDCAFAGSSRGQMQNPMQHISIHAVGSGLSASCSKLPRGFNLPGSDLQFAQRSPPAHRQRRGGPSRVQRQGKKNGHEQQQSCHLPTVSLGWLQKHEDSIVTAEKQGSQLAGMFVTGLIVL